MTGRLTTAVKRIVVTVTGMRVRVCMQGMTNRILFENEDEKGLLVGSGEQVGRYCNDQ
jgi:hypothetical protein